MATNEQCEAFIETFRENEWRGELEAIRLGLEAADAVVTEEMIADETAGHPIGSGSPKITRTFGSRIVGRWQGMSERLAQAFVECATEFDWSDLPPGVQSVFMEAATALTKWANPVTIVMDGES